MPSKMNCWEIEQCGREVNGKHADELGVCPAARESRLHGINDGKNAGRACWAVPGTLCGGKVQGNFGQKLDLCLGCGFYMSVRGEQGEKYTGSMEIIARI